jgi:hypothetical protein
VRGIEAGLATFLCYALLQNTLFHFRQIGRRAVVLVGLWLGLLPLYAVIYAAMPDDAAVWPAPLAAPSDLSTALSGGLWYVFLVMGYIVFFYLAESSVSIRSMIELASEPTRGLTLAELTGRYRYDWMLERRLRRLVHAGYLVERQGWYETTRRGRVAASVSAGVKRLLRLGPGG